MTSVQEHYGEREGMDHGKRFGEMWGDLGAPRVPESH